MKKVVSLCVLFIFLLLPSIAMIVYAHPGGTDGNGGHYNRSTGEYHYHHGYSAHDHYDMNGDGVVDCPYDFDDQTRNSRNSSNNSNSKRSTTNQEVARETKTKSTKSNYTDTFSKVFLSLFVLFPVAFLLTMPVLSIVSYILSCFGAELSDKIFWGLMYAVYFLISGYLIYLIIIW